jgi:hypothetical protein
MLILFDPKTQEITQFKIGEYTFLVSKIEHYTKLAMQVNEKVLFFEIDEESDRTFIEYLKEHTLQSIQYLKNFKHFKYKI